MPALRVLVVDDEPLIRLGIRRALEAVPDVVDIPPEIDAELRRLMALEDAYARRAAALPALTPAGLRAKAELVRLLHGADLAVAAECIEQRALASLCDDLIAPQG